MSHLPLTKKRTGVFHPFLLCILLFPVTVLSQNIGVNTLTPVAGLHVESNNGLLVTGEFGNGNLPLSGYGTRLSWNIKSGSFRAGRITDEDSGLYEQWWDFAHTGDYSFAAGLNSKAGGFASFAAGHKNQANGISAFAAGGWSNTALGDRSFVTGVQNNAPSYGEFVAGTWALDYTPDNAAGFDPDDRLFVIGNGTSLGTQSNAMTILKNGNTGIGVASPAYRMHILGNSAIDNGRLSFINTNGSVFIGHDAGTPLSNFNTAVGTEALKNTTNERNAAFGYQALSLGSNGSDNTAMGYQALYNNSSVNNTAIGIKAGHTNDNHSNTFLGAYAGELSTGFGNVFIGKFAGQNETGDEKLYIDNTNTATPLIYGDFAENTVTINNNLVTTNFSMTNGAGTGLLMQSDESGNGSWVAPSAVFSDDWNSSGGHIYNANTLNVGIGTSSPTAQLHVNGDVRLNNTKLSITGTGESIFIGENAGANDDLSSNQNVFIGQSAGAQNTTGEHNVAIGSDAANSSESASRNIAIGKSALASNTLGNSNIALGTFTLDNVTTGSSNIAVGQESLSNISTTSNNSAFGHEAGRFNTGSGNTFLGYRSGLNAHGSGNIFIGSQAGYSENGNSKLYIDNTNTSAPLIYGDFETNKIIINDSLATKYFQMTNGATDNYVMKSNSAGLASWTEPSLLFHDLNSNNLFLGDETGDAVTTAVDNTIVGAFAGVSLTTGYENTGLGFWSLLDLTTGTSNTAIGHNTLANNLTSSNNTAVGWSALSGTTGASNTAVGSGAGGENTSGARNVYIGHEAGFNNQGSDNILLGYRAGKNETGSNKLYIENSDSATPLIAGDFTTNEVTINDSLTVGKELSVGTSIAHSTLEINGSVAAKFKTPLVAGTTHPDGSGMVWRYNSGTGTITLPGAGTCANRIYVIINQTGTTRNISTYRDLTTTNQTTIGSSVALWLMSDGVEWWQIK